MLLGRGIFIIENLCSLENIDVGKSFDFFAFPLKIKADASFVRALAKVGF